VKSRLLRAVGASCLAFAAAGLAPGAPAYAGTAVMRVSKLDSPPVDARAGHAYRLHGSVANSGDGVASGAVTVSLVRAGGPGRVIGRGAAAVGPRSTSRYVVRVRLPAHLRRGSYALVACTKRADVAGALGCTTAEGRIEIGGGDPVRPPSAAAVAMAPLDTCTSGARTLSKFGDHVYPEMGNGGYTSVHTDIHLIYDAATNLFLPGNHVDLTDRATQCLSDFSLDFERSNVNTTAGPSMSVDSVTVNGQPATFTFVQPTYPGDPNGQDDPDPKAHQASQLNPVGGMGANLLPPACAPALTSTNSAQQNSMNGTACPANKLVITPAAPIPNGAPFIVTVNYTGRPGVHQDGDGTTEGWFRSNSPSGDGSFVTTEPVATEDWMPLNNHPTAKPTYDFYDTVNAGKTAIANGELTSFVDNPPDANFPGGSRTWHWHSPEPVANYLVENSIASFDLMQRVGADGILYYEAQGASIAAAQKATNLAIMDQQEDIVKFQSQFNGPFPFTSDGIVVGIPSASFQEEMQTKITFNGGRIGLQTFHHENMHQWWGDNVSESNFNLTYFKEGFAVLGEYLYLARNAQATAGGPDTDTGRAAFENSLIKQFNTNYANTGSSWTAAPSNPTPFSLFSTATTYTRPATTLIALRQILGIDNFTKAMQQMQHQYGGGNISEPQLEAAFHAWMPNQSAACSTRLDQFFTQWWDTVYPTGGGANKPQLTGPGLTGPGFYDATVGCAAAVPTTTVALSGTPSNGYYTQHPTVTLTATDAGAPVARTEYTVDGGDWTAYSAPFVLAGEGAHTLQYRSVDGQGNVERASSLTVQVDTLAPVTTAAVSPTPVAGAVSDRGTVTLNAVDATSGVALTRYSIDGGASLPYTGPFDLTGGGMHTVRFNSTDVAGNVEDSRSLDLIVDPTAVAIVGGSVASTLALSLSGQAASLGAFIPGRAADYTATLAANVISTAADATLSVRDPAGPGGAPGRLVNGGYALATPLQVDAAHGTGPAGAFAPLGSDPLTILTYGGPASNDTVTIGFQQSIAANEPLRTGTYAKTLVFTLATTSP
jgi:hypothetical protein